MEVKLRDKIEYMVAGISEFASKFRLTDVQAYRYLNFHKGISFLMDNYNILHTLDFNEAVECVALFCRKSGGKLRNCIMDLMSRLRESILTNQNHSKILAKAFICQIPNIKQKKWRLLSLTSLAGNSQHI